MAIEDYLLRIYSVATVLALHSGPYVAHTEFCLRAICTCQFVFRRELALTRFVVLGVVRWVLRDIHGTKREEVAGYTALPNDELIYALHSIVLGWPIQEVQLVRTGGVEECGQNTVRPLERNKRLGRSKHRCKESFKMGIREIELMAGFHKQVTSIFHSIGFLHLH